jgi:DNA-binding XRE family transcriptional regulator
MSDRDIECLQCHAVGTAELGTHTLRVNVGEKVVNARWLRFLKCSQCGYFQLSAQDAELLQLRAALAALRDCPEPSGAVLKFARKALGLRQSDVKKLLDYAAETVSRIENEAVRAPAPYAPALAGMLANEIVSTMGGDPEATVERRPAEREDEAQRVSRTG